MPARGPWSLAWLLTAVLLTHSLLCACRPAVAAPQAARHCPACCVRPTDRPHTPAPPADCPHCTQTLTPADRPVDLGPATLALALTAAPTLMPLPAPASPPATPNPTWPAVAPPNTLLRQHCALTL